MQLPFVESLPCECGSEEELRSMAVSWSFALLLVLTLVALITFSQPLFQPTPAEVRHTREDLDTAPPQILLTIKARESIAGSQRQWNTRKVIRGKEMRLQDICNGKRKTIYQPKAFSSTKLATIVASETHPPAARNINTKIPRRSVATHFESNRMVPTGPNPLHNNNRSQIIFP